MITTLLMSLMLPLGVAEGEPTFPGLSLQPGGMFRDPPVQVWLSKRDRLRRGDRVRAYAQADEDGYLLVLHAEPDGRIRVLFPLDPVDDHFVRAGETYEIRGRGDRDAFQVMESSGSGAVFAAFSRDPFRFDQLVRSDHWDYTLDTWVIGGDAEGDLVRLADYMAAGATYEYDLIRYEVNRYIAHGRYGSQLGLYVGSHYGRTSFGVSWGDPYYYSSWYYRPYRYVYYDPFYDPYYTPFFPVWYDACWYGPCFYRAHYYAYYSYGPRYYRGYYYPRGYDRDYYWRSGAGRYDGGRYAFKDGLAPRGIEPRSRAPLATAVTRRLLSPDDNRAGSIGRRTLGVNSRPQAATNGGRRMLTTPAQATPTRAAPATTTTRRAAEPVRRAPVIVGKPIRITNPPPQRGQPQAAPDRRQVQDPRRVTPDTPARAPERQAEPRGEVNRRELRDRMVVPDRRPPQQQSPRETTRPRLERRQPQSRPHVEPRSSPPPRAEPRSAAPPRAEPRSAPPPRAEPRSSPRPRAAPRSAPPPRAAARSSAPPRAAAPARSSTPPRAAPAPRGGRRPPPRRPG